MESFRMILHASSKPLSYPVTPTVLLFPVLKNGITQTQTRYRKVFTSALHICPFSLLFLALGASEGSQVSTQVLSIKIPNGPLPSHANTSD
jgi:hypothetical protein